MRQTGLFDAKSELSGSATQQQLSRGASKSLSCQFFPDFYSWLRIAHQCLSEDVAPDCIWWVEDRLAEQIAESTRGLNPDFDQLAHAASCHINEDRWALLYSILWRLRKEHPQLLELTGDPQVARLRKYARAVSRDVHKMKAFVRFRKVDGELPRYVSWFEPEHYIVQYAAPFFKRRFSNMCWSILTPVGCAHWEGAAPLWFSDAVEKRAAPAGDTFEDAWQIYYRSIFNPARLKINAMQSEMPKKYWKNLPEAVEIPALVMAAESRTREMILQRKSADQLRCGSRPEHPDQLVQRESKRGDITPLAQLKLKASLCTGCSLSDAATQTVFGQGPVDARVVIIGEQPGENEDLQGVPFVGPAGQVLDAALKRVGIDRDQCYLTNAVKHFGFEVHGRQRLHKRPVASVVAACGRWLQAELEIVQPDLVIYLGATAASTRYGPQVRVSRDRGVMVESEAWHHLITVHPASILRLQDRARKQQAYIQFVRDLDICAKFLQTPG